MDGSAPQQRAGEVAVVLLAASLDQAVRAVGWVASAVLYALAAGTVVIVFWLFVLAG
jgi:hypothetical protein